MVYQLFISILNCFWLRRARSSSLPPCLFFDPDTVGGLLLGESGLHAFLNDGIPLFF